MLLEGDLILPEPVKLLIVNLSIVFFVVVSILKITCIARMLNRKLSFLEVDLDNFSFLAFTIFG